MKFSTKLFSKKGKFMKVKGLSIKIMKVSDSGVELEVWVETKMAKHRIYPNLTQNFYFMEGQTLHLACSGDFKMKQRVKLTNT